MKRLTYEEAKTYTKHTPRDIVLKVLLELLREGKIKAYWSDEHKEVVWQYNEKGEVREE